MGEGSFGLNLFFTSFNFLLLVIVLILMGRKKVADGIKERGAIIKREMEKLEEEKKNLMEVKNEYLKKLENVEREAEELKAKAIAEMEKETEEMKKKIIESSARFEEAVERLIKNEHEYLLSSIKGEIVEAAVAVAKEIIKEKLKDEDETRMMDEIFSVLRKQ